MTSWRQRLTGLLPQRPAAKVPAPSRASAPATKAPAPAAKAPAPARKRAPPRHVLVTVLGLEGEALERVLVIAQTQCAAKRARPILVTDGHDFAPFRRRKLTVEQVVDAETRLLSRPDLPWRTYRRRQYALLAARWRPIAVISFGRSPDEDCFDTLQAGA